MSGKKGGEGRCTKKVVEKEPKKKLTTREKVNADGESASSEKDAGQLNDNLAAQESDRDRKGFDCGSASKKANNSEQSRKPTRYAAKKK